MLSFPVITMNDSTFQPANHVTMMIWLLSQNNTYRNTLVLTCSRFIWLRISLKYMYDVCKKQLNKILISGVKKEAHIYKQEFWSYATVCLLLLMMSMSIYTFKLWLFHEAIQWYRAVSYMSVFDVPQCAGMQLQCSVGLRYWSHWDCRTFTIAAFRYVFVMLKLSP